MKWSRRCMRRVVWRSLLMKHNSYCLWCIIRKARVSLIKLWWSVWVCLLRKRKREMCNTPFAQLWGKSDAKKPGGVRAMPSQMSLACFSVITDGSVYWNIYIYNYKFIGWIHCGTRVAESVFRGDGWNMNWLAGL